MFSLPDFIAPLDPQSFYDNHWRTLTPYKSHAASVAAALRELPELRDVERLVAATKGEVRLFGPKGFRAGAPASSALAFYAAGYSLYFTHAEAALSRAKAMFAALADDFGMLPTNFYLEAFAARAGGHSTMHFDHDANFQIVLSGDKRWRLAKNDNVAAPVRPFHPQARDGRPTNVWDETLAQNPEAPKAMPTTALEVSLVAGDVLFVPRGHWHEVFHDSDSLSLNIVLQPPSWATALANALVQRLLADPCAREWAMGPGSDGPWAGPGEEQFGSVLELAKTTLASVTAEEALLVADSLVVTWSAGASPREVREEGGSSFLCLPNLYEAPLEIEAPLVPFIAAIARLRHPFAWTEVCRFAGSAGAGAARGVLGTLVEIGALEKVVPPAA